MSKWVFFFFEYTPAIWMSKPASFGLPTSGNDLSNLNAEIWYLPKKSYLCRIINHPAVQLPASTKINMEIEEAVAQGLRLPIMETFYTIQGEGTFTGHPAYFIRLGGCDVGCVWCDVKESWEAGKWPVQTIEEIVAGALAYPGRLVVITGGEPLLYELGPLTQLLKEKGFTINIETSGTHKFSGTFDWVCFSPKKFKQPHPSIYDKADELKVVVFHKSDFAFAEQHATLVRKDCRKLLQPEWSKAQIFTDLIIDYVKKHPDWQISLQTHKFMDIP